MGVAGRYRERGARRRYATLTGGMEEGHAWIPVRSKHVQQCRRRDRARRAVGPDDAVGVATGVPAEELAPEDEPGLALVQDERAVGRVGHPVQPSLAAVEPLRVEPEVDRVGARLAAIARKRL